MNSNKGFTLIELLAVIVVLAIILVIAVPRVLNVIEAARKESYRLSVENILKSAKNRLVFDNIDPQTYKIYTITDGVFVGDSIPINGELPDNGKIYVKSENIIAVAVEKDNLCAIMQIGENNVRIETEGDCELFVPGVVLDSCFTYTPSASNAIITAYDSSCSKNFIIPSSLNGLNVITLGNHSFDNMQITSVEIPSSVELVEWNAFENNSLTTVILNNGLTEIGYRAFYNNSIKGITLPESLLTIRAEAFKDNEILSLIIPNSVTNMEWNAFKNNQIATLTIGTGLTAINAWAFSNNNLEELVVPNNVTSLTDGCFLNDSGDPNSTSNNIKKVTMPGGVSVSGIAISAGFLSEYDWEHAKAAGVYTASSQGGVWTKQ